MATATWIVITVDDLDDYLVAAQMTAVRTAALKEGQDDPFGAVMPAVVARVRAEIQGNPTNRVSETANSVPPSLKAQTCWLVLAAMQPRIPALRLSDDQKDLVADARNYLKRVGKPNGLPIEQPDDVQENNMQKAGGVDLASSETRNFTRTKMNGLL